MNKHVMLRFLFLLLLLLLQTLPAAANDCQAALKTAGDYYLTGRFQQAVAQAESCLVRGVSRGLRIRAQAFIAMAYAADGQTGEAHSAVEKLIALNADYEPELLAPQAFVLLLEDEKRRRAAGRVSSVSKSAEDLREVPATVMVITAEQILRRGYLDLEAVLHDLPGFSISRGNGEQYANIYMRGFRTNNNDHFLLRVNGVEQNDLFSGIAYLSRQYPLSSVQRIEVIYGPVSTIYGPNAYLGVIDVVAREPESFIDPKRKLGLDVRLLGRGSHTRMTDLSLAGKWKQGRVSWRLTGRYFESDEQDLSGFAEWDFDPETFEDASYNHLSYSNEEAAALVNMYPEIQLSPLVQVFRDESGEVVLVRASPQGNAFAADRDRDAMTLVHEGRPVGFSDPTRDWFLGGSLRFTDFRMDVQTWSRKEGATPWFSEQFHAGNGGSWRPTQLAISLEYRKSFDRGLLLNILTRFKNHRLSESSRTELQAYANGNLDVSHLALQRPSFWRTTRFSQLSTQYRNEIRLNYSGSDRFSANGGIELRDSSIQKVLFGLNEDVEQSDDEALTEVASKDQRDLGLFVQGSYRTPVGLKLTAGGRVDHNAVEGETGFGTVANLRLAAVYSLGQFTFKSIFAEAFKDASNLEKFDRRPDFSDVIARDDLSREEAENLEFGAAWFGQNLKLDLSAYRAQYSGVAIGTEITVLEPVVRIINGVPQQVTVPVTRSFLSNDGRYLVRGAQASADYRHDRVSVAANLSWTDPWQTHLEAEDGPDRKRVGDIAEWQGNLAVFTPLFKIFELSTRLNYVGERETGAGTTAEFNGHNTVDTYLATHLTLSADLPRGLKARLSVTNLLDETYAHPGVQGSHTSRYVDLLPQPGRTVYLGINYRY